MKAFVVLVAIFVIFLSLTGCGFTPDKETITVERIVYPELPPVPPIRALELQSCIPDRPRIWWQPKEVKNLTDCRAKVRENPDIVDNAAFERDCMEHAIDVNSNIVIGFDKEGQQCFELNREKIRMQLKIFQDRIDEVNRLREEWKNRNQELREK